VELCSVLWLSPVISIVCLSLSRPTLLNGGVVEEIIMFTARHRLPRIAGLVPFLRSASPHAEVVARKTILIFAGLSRLVQLRTNHSNTSTAVVLWLSILDETSGVWKNAQTTDCSGYS
jgi:hypothetical protein